MNQRNALSLKPGYCASSSVTSIPMLLKNEVVPTEPMCIFLQSVGDQSSIFGCI
jgi:hypothetical protein